MAPRNGETRDGLGCPESKISQGSPGRKAGFELKLDHIAEDLGGGAAVMDIARQCGDEKARKVVDLWAGLGDREKAAASLDHLCQEAGVTPGHLLGQVMGFVWRRSVDAATLITAVQMPAVIQKTIERALQPDGEKERTMVLEKIVPTFWPTNPCTVPLNGQQARSPYTDQNENLLDIPRVEDHNAVDRIFRDLGEE